MSKTLAAVTGLLAHTPQPQMATVAMLKTQETQQLGEYSYVVYKVINIKHAGEPIMPAVSTILVPSAQDFFAKPGDIVFLEGVTVRTSTDGRTYNSFANKHCLPLSAMPNPAEVEAMIENRARVAKDWTFTPEDAVKFF